MAETEKKEAKKVYLKVPIEEAQQAMSLLNNMTIKGSDAEKIVMIKSVFAGAEREEG